MATMGRQPCGATVFCSHGCRWCASRIARFCGLRSSASNSIFLTITFFRRTYLVGMEGGGSDYSAAVCYGRYSHAGAVVATRAFQGSYWGRSPTSQLDLFVAYS